MPGPRRSGRAPRDDRSTTSAGVRGRAVAWREPARAPSQRSLFGEILDWMLAPLLLLWPMSIVAHLRRGPLARRRALRPRAGRPHGGAAQQVGHRPGSRGRDAPRHAPARPAAARDEERHFLPDARRRRRAAGRRRDDFPRRGLYDFPAPGKVKLRIDEHRGDRGARRLHLRRAPTTTWTAHRIPVLVQVGRDARLARRAGQRDHQGRDLSAVPDPAASRWSWSGSRSSRGLAPLKRMQRRIRERRPDDLSPIDPRGAPEEIAPLVDAFNDLLERLSAEHRRPEALHRRRRAPDEDAACGPAHAGRARAARNRPAGSCNAASSNWCSARSAAAHLISQLLSLARTENLRDAIALEELDLAPLVARRGRRLGCRRRIDRAHRLRLRERRHACTDRRPPDPAARDCSTT